MATLKIAWYRMGIGSQNLPFMPLVALATPRLPIVVGSGV
jgi:hypothetical protein